MNKREWIKLWLLLFYGYTLLLYHYNYFILEYCYKYCQIYIKLLSHFLKIKCPQRRTGKFKIFFFQPQVGVVNKHIYSTCGCTSLLHLPFRKSRFQCSNPPKAYLPNYIVVFVIYRLNIIYCPRFYYIILYVYTNEMVAHKILSLSRT